MGIDPSRGFVAFPRGLTDWEWYSEPNTARLFFHLLLTATKSQAYLKRLMARGTYKLLEQLRTGSIELTIAAEGLSPGDVAYCTIPELGYKATVRVADVITQSQSDSTTRTVRLGTPVWRKL